MLLFKLRIAIKLLMYKLFARRTKLMNDERYTKLLFFVMFGRKANFDAPRTFNEFICARKVRRNEWDLSKYTDKYEVREFVRDTVGDKYLNTCFGAYASFDDIPFDTLPNCFALRGTHGSGYNIIVTDKASFDVERARKQFKKWLGENYYYIGREKNYYRIPPRIMCDEYLESLTTEGLPELKVFCFDGKAKFISYNMCMEGKTYTNYYDAQWNYMDVRIGYPHFQNADIPDNREEIIRVAEALAQAYDFVRVDLYNVDNRIVFSELTFHSGGGLVPLTPSEYDEKFAQYFMELENPV